MVKVFQNTHVILPVIHVENEEQALRNTALARDAGCDGVWLIHHDKPWRELRRVFSIVRKEHADWWVGVNCLDLDPSAVFHKFPEADGVWADWAGIQEHKEHQEYAAMVALSKTTSGFKGPYFGGIAFKYQRQVEDLVAAAQKASGYMDVVTTSGSKTGKSAPLEKIRMMSEALRSPGEERVPLAIASGLTPENVESYLGMANYLLVATGVSDGFHELDSDLISAFVAKVRAWQP